jgi:zinc transport system permease protein
VFDLSWLYHALGWLIGGSWLEDAIGWFNGLFPEGSFFSFNFNVHALLALILVSICCGAVGSLVVGGRMAFFSDALAHCAFAGVSIGFLFYELFLAASRSQAEFWAWVTPIMLIFGMLVGLGIALVRQRTGLASDTVIGVFFAGSIGLTGMLRKLISNRAIFSLEDFLFGDPHVATAADLIGLFLVALLTFGVLGWIYNALLLSTFNPSLALSRRAPVQLANAIFIMLLALIVNLCLRAVGVLLINALLVVPAATAVNISVNMRQVFWRTILICLGISLGGLMLSWEVHNRLRVKLDSPGSIILLGVCLFFLSAVLGPAFRGWTLRAGEAEPATSG